MENSLNLNALSHRTAVVSGASSGIGAAIASRLASEGAAVAILGRRTDRMEELAATALGSPGRIVPVTADITSDVDVDRAAVVIRDALGPIDLLVNVAGVALPNPLAEARSDEWSRMIETNLTGLLRVTRTFLPDLLARHEDAPADIINVSSIAAHVVIPDYAVYAATKAAVTAFSERQRAELAREGVRVTNIEPGLTRTDMDSRFDNERLRTELQGYFDAIDTLVPEDIADLVAYVVTRPAQVNLRHIVILPTQQV